MPVYGLLKCGKFSAISLYSLLFWDAITCMLDILTFVLEMLRLFVFFQSCCCTSFWIITSDLLILCCKTAYVFISRSSICLFFTFSLAGLVFSVFLYFLKLTEFIITSLRFLSLGCIIFVILGSVSLDWFPSWL